MQHVYVVGSKGLPGSYGGYETFLDKLTEYHQFNRNIQYHVACKANGDGVSPELMAMPDHFNYHNAECFKVHIPEVGSAQAVYYDCMALDHCIKHIRFRYYCIIVIIRSIINFRNLIDVIEIFLT